MHVNAYCLDCKHDAEATTKKFEEVKVVQCKAGENCKCDHKNFRMIANRYFTEW